MSDGSLARRLGRHLEGWQLGLLVISMALLSALLAVPRNVPPELVPPPVVDRIEQRQALEAEARHAARARAGLPLEIRSVGEAVRRYGQAAYAAPELSTQVSTQLRRLAAEALARQGAERLLELRALQTELFVAALSPLRSATAAPPAKPPSEAIELGGGLVLAGERRAWFEPPPLGADADELATLYRLYWSEAVGLRAHPFALTLNEWRVYYRFLLGRPTSESDRAGDLRRKLEYVAALASHDQEYPAHLARGVLLYQSGNPIQSAGELRRHLERSPDGPWSLRARNYLAACGALLERLSPSE
jgi:hypothetical protein